jgi:hypothetical protein
MPGPHLTPGKTRYPLYRRLGGPHGRSGQVCKISPPLGFDPWTIQPVGSRYTDYATWPTVECTCLVELNLGLGSKYSEALQTFVLTSKKT